MKILPFATHSRLAGSGLTLIAALLLSACATAPTDPGSSQQAEPIPVGSGPANVVGAFEQYQRRDFAAASAGFEVATEGTRQEQRLGHLGQALIRLSTDSRWRDLDAATRHLQAAEELVEGSSVETSMLLTAMSALVGVEANITELNSKLANANAESARLKNERDDLVAEQAVLNEAIEKLKALTIGN